MAKISLQQIADAVGVSKFAVSRALAGKSGVKDETRDKIVDAATRLGYYAQQKPARSKEEQPSGSLTRKWPHKKAIAVVMPDVESQNAENPYWGKVLQGITNEIQRWEGLSIVIVTEQFAHSLSAILNTQALFGYIGVGFVPTPLLLEIKQSGLPYVFVDYEAPLLPSDAVFMNNYESVRRMTQHLISIGHSRFQFVGNKDRYRSRYDRWRGYVSALDDSALSSVQDPGLITISYDNLEHIDSQVADRLDALASSGTLPTAFVCANDQFAMAVWHSLRRLGLKVPDDCSITGFDDIVDPAFGLTTIRSTKEALGQRAVEMLMRRAERPDSPTEQVLLTGELLIRKSTGVPAAAPVAAARV